MPQLQIFQKNTENIKIIWEDICHHKLLALYFSMPDNLTLKEIPYYTPSDASESVKILILFLSRLKGVKATIKVYARYLCLFANHVRKDFRQVNILDMEDFLIWMKNKYSENTCRLALGSIRSFYRMANNFGLMNMNPAQAVDLPKFKESEKIVNIIERSLSPKRINLIIKFLQKNSQTRNLALFSIMARMGLRASEVCSLRWKNMLIYQDIWVLKVMGKGNSQRMILIPDETLNFLFDLRQENFDLRANALMPEEFQNYPIFCHLKARHKGLKRHSLNLIMRNISKDLKIRDFSPHDLRHTAFTHLTRLGVPINEIKAIAGHESIETTSIYIDAGKVFSGGTAAFNG